MYTQTMDRHMNVSGNGAHEITNLFSTQQLMIMMLPTLIHTITGLLTGIITLAFSSAGFGILINFLKGFKKKSLAEPTELIITQSMRVLKVGMVIDGDQSYNCNLIFAILRTLTNLNLPITTANVNLQGGCTKADEMLSLHERMMGKQFHIIPRDSYQYDGMTISYEKLEITTSGKDDNTSIGGLKYELKISSYTKTFAELESFAMKCYREWVNANYPSDGKVPRKLFYQIKSLSPYPVFKEYKYGICDPEKAFDGIFIPKQYLRKIHTLLRKIKNGEINKLIILFTGRPGCGKTTLQRAILESLDRHCIVQKLAHTSNDEELMDTYFSEIVHTSTGDECDILLDERVYLLEDVDAESKLLHCRKRGMKDQEKAMEIAVESKDALAVAMASSETTCSPVAFGSRPTMSGYLNAIDGIMRLKKAVILMSSNHPELLDEAVTRHGRITYKIDLREMKRDDAHDMIRYHFNDETVRDELITDDTIVPCDLEALCQNCETIEELEEGIVELYAGYNAKNIESNK
jgi:hypothetical protein